MAAIELHGIFKRFGETDVLRGVNLKLKSGEFVVFVGPSGCGKSTLLRILAGLEQPSDGQIIIDGKDATKLRPTARGVAMVFQNYALYPHMTVAENIGFGLKISGVAKAERKLAVDKAAAALRLTPLLARKPAALSGGQRQRVAIGRAIVKQPEIFLFDEPLSNLDADLRGEMRLEIGRLHRSLATTMVYVTHDQVEAMTLADKIVVLRDGSVEQVGTPDELYRSPANTFVARFLGSPKMNLLDKVIVERSDGRAFVRLPVIGEVDISRSIASKLSAGEAISVGIRAQYLALSNPAGDESAEVMQVEHLGDVAHVYLACPDGQTMVVSMTHGPLPTTGDRVGISLEEERMLCFGPDGRRL